MVTYFLVSPLFPSAGAWCCLPPCPALPRTAPSTCGEDAEGDERLADHVTPVLVPSWIRVEKSFLGLPKCFGAPAAPLPPGGLREERGCPARSVQAASVSGGARRSGGGAESQLCALRRQAHFCSIPAAGALGPPAPSPNPSHPALLRGQGHPLAFSLPVHRSQESRPRAASAGQWALGFSF